MTRAKDLRDLSDGELVEHLRTQRREWLGLRFQHATAELENTSSLKHAKQEIARTLTIVRERGLDTTNA